MFPRTPLNSTYYNLEFDLHFNLFEWFSKFSNESTADNILKVLCGYMNESQSLDLLPKVIPFLKQALVDSFAEPNHVCLSEKYSYYSVYSCLNHLATLCGATDSTADFIFKEGLPPLIGQALHADTHKGWIEVVAAMECILHLLQASAGKYIKEIIKVESITSGIAFHCLTCINLSNPTSLAIPPVSMI